jgi:3-oxoacyl-[acyl-carrier-protein] synthase II
VTGVVVTGLGAVCPVGSGVEALWTAMAAARRPEPVEFADLVGMVPTPLAYRIPPADLPAGPEVAGGVPLGSGGRLALACTGQALGQAGLAGRAGLAGLAGPTAPDPARTAVLWASGVSDAAQVEDWRSGRAAPPAGWLPSFAQAGVVAEAVGAGTATSLSNACAGGAYAVAMGADLIRSGDADVVVAGAAETCCRVTVASFNRLGAVDPRGGCRPFDRHRAGTAMAEGSAAVVLEREDTARARGATPLARVLGSGWSCDAYHATAPEPTGELVARAVAQALADGGRGPEDIGLVVPHATGTELSDPAECRALHRVFGGKAADIPLYSLKALIGHTGAPSGTLGLIAAVLMLRRDELPANVPIDEQDPDCDVRLPTTAQPPAGPVALVNAFAFGGLNLSLLVEAAAA